MDDTNQPPAEQPSGEPPVEQRPVEQPPAAEPPSEEQLEEPVARPPDLSTAMAPPSAIGARPAPIPPPPGIGGPGPAAPPWGLPAPPGGHETDGMSTRTKVLIAVGGLVAVAIVAIVVVAALGGSSKLHLPATLGGQPRLTSEVAKGLAEGMKNEIKKQGAEAPIIALYGPPTSAKYILMEFNRSVEKDYPSLQEAMKSVGTGVARTAGSLDLARAVYDTRGGTDYGCAPVNTSGSPLGSMCIWDDGSTTGFTVLVSVTELQTALEITAEAHDASVS